MKLLLDTHAVLWFMLNDRKLSDVALAAISDAANDCLVSPVSHWETAIKISLGKFKVSQPFESLWDDVLARFNTLPIEASHSARLLSMPFHHRDPFDRMLVAQALVEQIPLVSCDDNLDRYGIQRVW